MGPGQARTLRERGIGFDLASEIFDQPVLQIVDARRDCGEVRVKAIGQTTDGRLLGRLHRPPRLALDHLGARRIEKGASGMATTRMTREQIAKSVTPERRAEFQRRIDATTDVDIQRQMIEDGEDPDADIADAEIISPAHIRKRLGMTQVAFATAIGVPIGTLRNWEQNRVTMEPAAIALFRILARDPKAALRALGRQAA